MAKANHTEAVHNLTQAQRTRDETQARLVRIHGDRAARNQPQWLAVRYAVAEAKTQEVIAYLRENYRGREVDLGDGVMAKVLRVDRHGVTVLINNKRERLTHWVVDPRDTSNTYAQQRRNQAFVSLMSGGRW